MAVADWGGKIEVGDTFRLADEGIMGEVISIECDADGFPASVVLHLDDGKWAAVDLSRCSPTDEPRLH